MMKNMKKQYIKPALEVFEVKTMTLLAGSDPDSIYGGVGGSIDGGYVD